jgi:hypothetical protein
MKEIARIAALLLAALALAGCPKPLPPDRESYVGIWRGEHVQLEITAEGMVHYRKVKGGTEVTINAPLDRFEGNDFFAGWKRLSTRFVVSRPPFEEDGRWKMVVDGERLERVGRRVPGAREKNQA